MGRAAGREGESQRIDASGLEDGVKVRATL